MPGLVGSETPNSFLLLTFVKRYANLSVIRQQDCRFLKPEIVNLKS